MSSEPSLSSVSASRSSRSSIRPCTACTWPPIRSTCPPMPVIWPDSPSTVPDIASRDWVNWREVASAFWSTLAASAPKLTSARPLTAEISLSSWPVRCVSSATALSRRLNRLAADSMLCCSLPTLCCSLVSRSSCDPQRLHRLAHGVAHRLQLGQRRLDVLRDGAHVGPQRVQLGHRGDLGPEQLHVLGQRLGPLRRLLRGLVQVLAQLVQLGRHAGDLALAHLLDQPLEPFHPLPDVFQRAGVRPLVADVVLYRASEQLAHAIGGGRLVPANQDVIARLIHDASRRGDHPGAERARWQAAGTDRNSSSSQ